MSKNIYYVGNTGFPFGHAQVERQKLIARGLIKMGCGVTVLNTYGVHKEGSHGEVFSGNVYEEIKFVYTSGTPYRSESFIKRNLLKAKGTLNAIRVLFSEKKRKQLDTVLVTCNSIFTVLFYGVTCRLIGVPVVIDVVEYRGATKIPKSLFKKIDHYLYDRWYHIFVSKIICISDFLINVAKANKIKRPLIKIPSIVDYSIFDAIPANKREPSFFLYCGSTHYFEVILFILEAYRRVGNSSMQLYLVLHGDKQRIAKVNEMTKDSPDPGSVTVMSGLPYQDLVALYKSAYALLIPLRDTFQDVARFPHKVGEYCAAGRPIVSTRIGEVGNFFTDMDNAMLAPDFDEDQFSEKMRILSNDQPLATIMGGKSYELGKNNFDYIRLGEKIYHFMFDKKGE